MSLLAVVAAIIAVLAGLMQARGYITYGKKVVQYEKKPNPIVWFMFAYGTSILTVIEYDQGAAWYLIVLPIVCATLSVGMFLFVFMRALLTRSFSFPDRVSMLACVFDIFLTVAYVTVNYKGNDLHITPAEAKLYSTLFLVLVNASTVVSFIPLLKDAWKDPESEHPKAWFEWTVAYFLLGVATVFEEGTAMTVFMIYPASCVVLHGVMGVLTSRTKRHPETGSVALHT